MNPPLTVSAERPPSGELSALETLLHPLTADHFLTEYWQRNPVHITGWSERFAGLFDRKALGRVLARRHELGISVRVSGDHEGDDGGAGAHIAIDGDDVVGRLREGTSLCVDPVDRADPTVAEVAERLRVGLRHLGPVSVKCYLSSAGFGFNTHFDAQVVTTVQIEGAKRWRISPRPGVAFPRDNAFLDGSGTVRYNGRTPSSLRPWECPAVDRASFLEVVLEPGDVLCLPAGTWHEAKASGGASLALNFSFSPVDLPSLLLDLVRPALEDRVQWRSGLVGEDAPARLAERAAELAAALADLASGPPLAPERLADLANTTRTRSGAQPTAAGLAAAVAASSANVGHRIQCVLAVSDASRAAQWYTRVLGGGVVATIPEFGWVEVGTGTPGVTLGLTEVPTAVSNGGAVLDFEVDDVERIRAVLADNGVDASGPTTEIAGVARILSAHDPDGNLLMFFQPHEGNPS